MHGHKSRCVCDDGDGLFNVFMSILKIHLLPVLCTQLRCLNRDQLAQSSENVKNRALAIETNLGDLCCLLVVNINRMEKVVRCASQKEL